MDIEKLNKQAEENAKSLQNYVTNTMTRRFVLPVEISDEALKAASYAACRKGGIEIWLNGRKRSLRNYKLLVQLVPR